MEKLILISGANGSGKSLFAEKLVEKLSGKRYYIATMRPVTHDNIVRIEKHRKQRERLGFETLELPVCITETRIESGSVVLLEDVSNLLSNVMFELGGNDDDVFGQITTLCKCCGVVIAVTISDLEYTGNDSQTLKYLNSLEFLNKRLFERCSAAVLMRDNIPQFIKGDINDIY